MIVHKLMLAIAACVVVTACAAEQDRSEPPRDIPGAADPAAPLPGATLPMPQHGPAHYPPSIARQRACGAYIAIDKLADTARVPQRDPGKPTPQPNGDELMKYANALNTVDREDVSAALTSAVHAHVYALTNLGVLINNRASADDIGLLSAVADATGHTVYVLCDAPEDN